MQAKGADLFLDEFIQTNLVLLLEVFQALAVAFQNVSRRQRVPIDTFFAVRAFPEPTIF